MPLPIVADLDGQGASDVLFVRHPQWDKGELLAVSGRDGHVKWNWAWDGQIPTTSDPIVVDFGGKGRRCVCLLTTEIIKVQYSTTYQPQLMVFDGAGKIVKRIDFKGSGPIGSTFNGNRTWWRSIDLGGGPKQALLFFDEGALQALGGESIEPLWKWRLAADDATIVDVLPAGKRFPTTIAIWSGKSIYGLSCETGRPRWRGEMPSGGPNYSNGETERVVMRDSNGLGLPRLLWGDGLRLTWPTDDAGRYAPPRGEPMTYAPVPEPVSLRALPWAEAPEIQAIPVILKMVPWALLWMVVPALLIRWAFRRNSWRLAFIPAFYQLAVTLALNLIPLHWLPFNRQEWVQWDPHVAVCALSGLFLAVHAVWMLRRRLWMLVDASAIYAIAIGLGLSHQIERGDAEPAVYVMHTSALDALTLAAIAAGGLPLIAAMVWSVNWLRRGQWLRLVLFIVGSIVCSVGLAAAMIGTNQWANHFEEQYSWDGWWLILIYGVYGAAVLSILGWLGKRALTWCRRKIPRLIARLGRKKAA